MNLGQHLGKIEVGDMEVTWHIGEQNRIQVNEKLKRTIFYTVVKMLIPTTNPRINPTRI